MNPVFEENDIIIATLGALSKLTTTGMIFRNKFLQLIFNIIILWVLIIIITKKKSIHFILYFRYIFYASSPACYTRRSRYSNG